MEVTKVV